MSNKLEFVLALRDNWSKGWLKAEGQAKRSMNNIKTLASSLIALPHLLEVAAPVVAIAQMSKASMEMDAIRAKMQAAVPTFGAAGREINFISSEADRMGLNFKTVSGEYATFAASATRVGLSVKETRGIFKNMSEAMVSLKLDSGRVGLVFTALSQMASKGTVSMEELKRQLGDSLPAAVQIGARAMGMTTKAFEKAVSKNEIMSRDFLPRFADQVKKELGGSFELASHQQQASINRMSNAWFKLSAGLGQILSGDITNGINLVTKGINGLANNMNTLKAVFEVLKTPITIVWNELQNVFLAAKMLGDTIGTLVSVVLTPFIEAFGLIGDVSALVGKNISALVKGDFAALGSFGDAFKGVKEHFNSFIETEKKLFSSHDSAWNKFVAGTDKNYKDMADQAARAWVAIQNAGIKTKPGSTDVIEGKPVENKSSDVDSDRSKKLYEQGVKLLNELRKRDVADAKARYIEKEKIKKLEIDAENVYERVRIDSMGNANSRELALLDLKYKQERKKYKDSKAALINIERAYEIERSVISKNIRREQIESTKSFVNTVAESLMAITAENRKFAGLYKAAAIVQIIADTMV
ncbi:MAG: tape measure protein, partial [Smithella sp.]